MEELCLFLPLTSTNSWKDGGGKQQFESSYLLISSKQIDEMQGNIISLMKNTLSFWMKNATWRPDGLFISTYAILYWLCISVFKIYMNVSQIIFQKLLRLIHPSVFNAAYPEQNCGELLEPVRVELLCTCQINISIDLCWLAKSSFCSTSCIVVFLECLTAMYKSMVSIVFSL